MPDRDDGPALPASADARKTLTALRAQSAADDVLPRGLADGFRDGREGLRAHFSSAVNKAAAAVTFPRRATSPVRITDSASGAGIEVAVKGAREIDAQTADGYVVYRNAYSSGATLLHRPLPEGVEDFVSFDERPRAASVSYEIALGEKVAGLRLVAGTLELLDAGGAPRLRVAPPYIVGADGVRTDAVLAVQGCAVDTNPAAPWGRRMKAPGARSCTVRVSWNGPGVKYPAVLDPKWTTTGNMTAARQDHTAIKLSTGFVLVAGGRTGTGDTVGLNTAELFNPADGTWAATGSMSGARWSHTATQLNAGSNPNTSGRVLVTGGFSNGAALTTARLYDVAGTWSSAATMGMARHLHTATLLSNGSVLVAGGISNGAVTGNAGIYNPGGTGMGSWTPAGSMSPRRFHTATLLDPGGNSNFSNRVVVVGGNSGNGTSVQTYQLFNPSTSSWSTAANLPGPREGHTATKLANGNVLITGGKSGSTVLPTTFVFTIPGSGSTPTFPDGGSMSGPRTGHTATLLQTGKLPNGQQLVVAGGSSDGTASIATADLWDGASLWTPTTNLGSPVQGHTATLLTGGRVLIAGGINSTANPPTVNVGQVYDPSLGLGCASGAECASGYCVGGVCCDQACTDQCKACDVAGLVGTCSPRSNGTACDDGNPCTELDSCSGGACQGARQFACVTPDTCQEVGTCNPAKPSPTPPSGPIAWWKLEGDGADATGGGHTLNEGGAVRAPGRVGFGMKFDGSSCMWAPIWEDARMQNTTGLTVMAWINANDPAGCPYPDQYGQRAVIGRGYDYSFGVMCMSAAPGPGVTGAVRGPGALTWGYGGGIGFAGPDEWHHVATTWDHGWTITYLDGRAVQAFQGPDDVSDMEPQFMIGCLTSYFHYGDQHWRHFVGTIDEAMLYGRALSPQEIYSYYWDADPCSPHQHLPDNTACHDGDLCTLSDRCQSGTCTATSPPITCTPFDACHEAPPCIWWAGCHPHTAAPVKPDGTVCSDGNACTGADTCQSGACTGSNPLNCDDGNPCTADACDAVAGCTHAPVACTRQYEAESYDVAQDISKQSTAVTPTAAGAWARYAIVDFGQPGEVGRFKVMLLDSPGDRHVQLRLDSPTGTLVADLVSFPSDAAFPAPQSTEFLTAVSGVHTVVIVFGSADAGKLDWFALEKSRGRDAVTDFPPDHQHQNPGEGLPSGPLPIMEMEEDEALASVVWFTRPEPFILAPGQARAMEIALPEAVTVVGQARWSDPAGDVLVSIYDSQAQLIASAQAPPNIGLTQIEAMSGIVPAQHVVVGFTNNGSAPLSVTLLAGAVRGNQ